MPTLNTFGSARGFGRAGAAKPNAPTINSVTRNSNTQVTIAYTLGSNNGAPITNINIVSSPSISLTFTNTDLDGSIAVTGSFVAGQEYTFTMTATNVVGTSDASSASTALRINTSYALLQTFNSSGTFTVPTGVTKIAAAVVGAGARGGMNAGNNDGQAGGGGGGGVIFADHAVNSGSNYTITIGTWTNTPGAAGASSILQVANNTTIANANGGSYANNQSASSSNGGNGVSNIASKSTGNGGAGGAGGGFEQVGFNGTAAGTSGSISLTTTNSGTINLAFGGGGGGGGGASDAINSRSGGTGGATYGGSGQAGKRVNTAGNLGGSYIGGSPGGGGGGAGGTGNLGAGQGGNFQGSSGRVLIYGVYT